MKLTKGEYLDALGAAIANQDQRNGFESRKRSRATRSESPGTWLYVDQRQAKRLATLAANRERYKGRLQEVATVTNIQPNVVIENDPDVFLGSGGSRIHIPVYKVDPALAELAKTGAPQWVVVGWTGQLNQPTNKRLHDAIINNFDFEFLYNYFFAPEKVTGRSYAPLHNPAAVAPVVTTTASASNKARAADPNVYFFDDFSTTPVGKPPVGWKSTLNKSGASSTVVTIDGMPGQWATTTGFTLTPGQIEDALASRLHGDLRPGHLGQLHVGRPGHDVHAVVWRGERVSGVLCQPDAASRIRKRGRRVRDSRPSSPRPRAT